MEAACQLDAQGGLLQRPPKSIRRDSTFEPEEGRREQIEAMLAYLLDRATARLRSHGLVAGSMEVRLVHVDTRPPHLRRAKPEGSGPLSARRKLTEPSPHTDLLWEHARGLLRGLPRPRALVKRVGLSLLSLRAQGASQGLLFSDPGADRAPASGLDQGVGGASGSRAERARALDQTLDALRKRHGFGALVRGASLPLLGEHKLGNDGFILRTPSLNQ